VNDDNFHKFFVRSHHRPGVFYGFGMIISCTTYHFYVALIPYISDVRISTTQDLNQMSRNFNHPRTGHLCYQIGQTNNFGRFKLHYELLNLDKNQVESEGLVEKNEVYWSPESIEFINIAQLKAGNYQLTLKNISADDLFVGLCSGMVSYFKHFLL
jgi:hypothetical protein